MTQYEIAEILGGLNASIKARRELAEEQGPAETFRKALAQEIELDHVTRSFADALARYSGFDEEAFFDAAGIVP